MDDYTFIVMAKLKADRLKLERAQREQHVARAADRAESIDRNRGWANHRWYSPEPQWRQQI